MSLYEKIFICIPTLLCGTPILYTSINSIYKSYKFISPELNKHVLDTLSNLNINYNNPELSVKYNDTLFNLSKQNYIIICVTEKKHKYLKFLNNCVVLTYEKLSPNMLLYLIREHNQLVESNLIGKVNYLPLVVNNKTLIYNNENSNLNVHNYIKNYFYWKNGNINNVTNHSNNIINNTRFILNLKSVIRYDTNIIFPLINNIYSLCTNKSSKIFDTNKDIENFTDYIKLFKICKTYYRMFPVIDNLSINSTNYLNESITNINNPLFIDVDNNNFTYKYKKQKIDSKKIENLILSSEIYCLDKPFSIYNYVVVNLNNRYLLKSNFKDYISNRNMQNINILNNSDVNKLYKEYNIINEKNDIMPLDIKCKMFKCIKIKTDNIITNIIHSDNNNNNFDLSKNILFRKSNWYFTLLPTNTIISDKKYKKTYKLMSLCNQESNDSNNNLKEYCFSFYDPIKYPHKIVQNLKTRMINDVDNLLVLASKKNLIKIFKDSNNNPYKVEFLKYDNFYFFTELLSMLPLDNNNQNYANIINYLFVNSNKITIFFIIPYVVVNFIMLRSRCLRYIDRKLHLDYIYDVFKSNMINQNKKYLDFYKIDVNKDFYCTYIKKTNKTYSRSIEVTMNIEGKHNISGHITMNVYKQYGNVLYSLVDINTKI